jgi:hypothetical protein
MQQHRTAPLLGHGQINASINKQQPALQLTADLSQVVIELARWDLWHIPKARKCGALFVCLFVFNVRICTIKANWTNWTQLPGGHRFRGRG